MDSILRISSVVPPCAPGDPQACADSALELVSQTAQLGTDLIVLPALALSGASCGTLLSNRAVLRAADDALRSLARKTADTNAYMIIGLPAVVGGKPASVCAVLNRGRILDLIPALDGPAPLWHAGCPNSIPEAAGLADPFTLYQCGDLRFCVLPCHTDRLPFYAAQAVSHGAQLLVVPSCSAARAGELSTRRQTARFLSRSLGCAIALCNGGVGESSSPDLYTGFGGVYEGGAELAFRRSCTASFAVTADIDTDILTTLSPAPIPAAGVGIGALKPNPKARLLRRVERNPFLPADFSEAQDYLEELFRMQAEALAARMEKTGLQYLVLGVSGGVDSTLAILVGAKALDILNLPRHNLIGVTMPGFGTTDRTYFNSLSLIEGVGAQRREISIKKSVLQHFEDIGQDPGVHDTTYENAQARERTQILFDLANQLGGLVVGTGDLSEAALGWCTFGGDQLASYNVNASITKNVARAILRQQAESKDFCMVRTALLDVLDTPVSPELLPPALSGEIHQKTEDILGPYELHEFFLYYFVRYQMAPSKIVLYAAAAFEGVYEREFIRHTLRTFIKRFFGGQFKRSCAPDTAALTDISLNGAHFTMPSDATARAMLEDLDSAL